MAVFCFVSEHHLDGKAATKEVGVRPIHVWWRWRYRSARFRARRHAAPKNSPPDCFLYGCFDYTPQQKYKSTTRVLLIFGGDVQHRNFVNFSKCPETLINLRYNFYDFLNLPLIIPHNDIQTVIFKI